MTVGRIAYVALFILIVLLGCRNENKDALAASTPNSSSYLSESVVWKWMQQGSVFCYELRKDGTCTLVEYPSAVGKANGVIERIQYSTSASGTSAKIVSTQKLELRQGSGICSIITPEFYDSHLIYRAANNRARITNDDDLVQNEKSARFVEDLKRSNRQLFGMENCYRYVATRTNEDGAVVEMQEHAFIDGVRQARIVDSRITFFTKSVAKADLMLRSVE